MRAVPMTIVYSYQIIRKASNPSPLKGILVKHKNSRSMSSLATGPGPQLDASVVPSYSAPKLNRASLHLPLTSHHVSPPSGPYPSSIGPGQCPPSIGHNVPAPAPPLTLRYPPPVLTKQETKDDSFTWSEIGIQTEVNYEWVDQGGLYLICTHDCVLSLMNWPE